MEYIFKGNGIVKIKHRKINVTLVELKVASNFLGEGCNADLNATVARLVEVTSIWCSNLRPCSEPASVKGSD